MKANEHDNNENETTVDERDVEVIEPERSSIVLRHPRVPTTINELAALEDDAGLEVIKARTKILQHLRLASIASTYPNDWTLFKDRDGRITGFLGDQGCDRIKANWGIQISNLGPMTRIEDSQHPGEFAYSITGDGVSRVTGESVFSMEGVRYSTEKYALEKPEGIQRVVAVQKAARANLDGGITRELAGMKSVPVEELKKGWEGVGRSWEQCNKGRGFGTASERTGTASAAIGVDPQDYPICDVCVARFNKTVTMVFKKSTDANKGDYWYCPNFKQHEKERSYIAHADLLKRLETTKKPADAPSEA